jgi:hypothetical protein
VDVFLLADIDHDDGPYFVHGSGYSVDIGGVSILNLWYEERVKDADGNDKVEKSPRCMLIPYKVTDDGMLHQWDFDESKLQRHIEEEKLKGSVTKEKFSTNIKIHATSEELETFFKTIGVAELTEGEPQNSFYRLIKPDVKPFTPPAKP